MLRIDWQAVDDGVLDSLPAVVDLRRIAVQTVADLETWCASMLDIEGVRLFDDAYKRLAGSQSLSQANPTTRTVIVQPCAAVRDHGLGKRAPSDSTRGNLRHDIRTRPLEKHLKPPRSHLPSDVDYSTMSREDRLSSTSAAPVYRECTFISDCRIVIGGGQSERRLAVPGQPDMAIQTLRPRMQELTGSLTQSFRHPAPRRSSQIEMMQESLDNGNCLPPAGQNRSFRVDNKSSDRPLVGIEGSSRDQGFNQGQIQPSDGLQVQPNKAEIIASKPTKVKKLTEYRPKTMQTGQQVAKTDSDSEDESESDDSSLKAADHTAKPRIVQSKVAAGHKKPVEVCAKKPVKYQQDSRSSESDDEADPPLSQPVKRQQYMGIMDTLKASANKPGSKMAGFAGVSKPSAAQTRPIATLPSRPLASKTLPKQVTGDDSSSDEDSSDEIVTKTQFCQPPRSNSVTASLQVTAKVDNDKRLHEKTEAGVGRQPISKDKVQLTAANGQANVNSVPSHFQTSNPLNKFVPAKHSEFQTRPVSLVQAEPLKPKIDLDLTKLEVDRRKGVREGFVEIDSEALQAIGDVELGQLFTPNTVISYKQLTIDDDLNVVVDSETSDTRVVLQAGKMLGVVDFEGCEDEVMIDSFYELAVDCRQMTPKQLAVLDKVRKGGPIKPAAGLTAAREHPPETVTREREAACVGKSKGDASTEAQQVSVNAEKGFPASDSQDDEEGPTRAGQKERDEMAAHKDKYRKMASVDSTMSQTEKDVSHQVNYYFGDKNYFNDRFILNHVAHDPELGNHR